MSDVSGPITRPSDLWRWIWSEEGWRCVVFIKATARGKAVKTFFVATNDEAETLCLQYDAAGWDAYHATATYQGNEGRTQDNAHQLRSLWLDCDFGAGRKYSSLEAAWDGYTRFVQQYGLPPSIVVGSGSGFHIYWPLSRAVSPEQWVVVANALKLACERSGFHADPARTCDSASLLRVVGTRNFKYGAGRLVTCGPAVPPVELEELRQCLGSRDDGREVASVNVSVGEKTLRQPDELGQAASAIYAERPTDGERIANECAQVRAMRDSAGNVPEPIWYAVLEVLVHCGNGRRLAHAWSSGYPRYTASETDKKLAHAAEHGPTTCARFASLNPSGCEECPHRSKITSPVQVGRDPDMIMAPKSMTIDPTAEKPTLPKLPWPFKWNDWNQLVTENKDGETTIVYRHPIAVIGFSKGESQGGRSVAVTHWNPKENWTTETIELTSVDSKTILSKFMRVGINVHSAVIRQFLDFLHRSIDTVADARKTEITYDQFGWKEDWSFLLGNELYCAPRGDFRRVSVSPEAQQRADMLRARGYLADWKIAANKLFQPGFEGSAFAMLCGFAAPLMRFLRSNGGCIVHQVGQTGGGKTMGLRAAWTIWGEEHACNINAIDTMNSRYRELAVVCHLPVIFDEMLDRDHEEMKKFILAFSDGRDKNRLDREGHLRKLRFGWSTVILSAANRSLVQAAMTAGDHAQAARILEYSVGMPDHFDQSMGMKLQRIFEANRGHAGREFVRGLVQPDVHAYCAQMVLHHEEQISKRIGRGSEHRFFSQLLAAVKVAGDLLQHWEMLEFNVDKYVDFGIEKAVDNRGGIVDQLPQYPRLLQRYLNTNLRHTLIMPRNGKLGEEVQPLHRPTESLTIRIERHDQLAWVEREAFRTWATENHIIFAEMEKKLAADGVVTSERQLKNIGANTSFSATGAVACWRINLGHPSLAQIALAYDAAEIDRDARDRA